MPLQPPAMPAAIIVIAAGGRVEQAHYVGQQRRERQADQHERDGRCSERMLVERGGANRPAPMTPITIAIIARCSLRPACSPSIRCAEEHQHEQAAGERRLHDDERSEQQRDDLQRPAEDRQAGAEQPACAAEQAPGQRQAQVLAVRRVLGVHRLQGDA